MSDNGIGDFFIDDLDDETAAEDEEPIAAPVVVPVTVAQPAPRSAEPPAAAQTASPPAPATPAPATAARPSAEPPVPAPVTTPPAPEPAVAAPMSSAPQPAASAPSREQRLAAALDGLIEDSPEIQAAALVSMDGFTMAAALPDGMHEDRVGAMSAAILGLGERAAAELGRGHLSQVFIEGKDGYVLLTAAGDRAVLTVLAGADSKLGLIIYDMRNVAARMAEILG